ncbi:MAG TPA: hypothetical protein VGD40_03305, partial [Chryseosolibacter sp.]
TDNSFILVSITINLMTWHQIRNLSTISLTKLICPNKSAARKCLVNTDFILKTSYFGLVCDNKLFIKPTVAGRNFACQASSPVSGTMRALDVTPREIVARLQRLGVST